MNHFVKTVSRMIIITISVLAIIILALVIVVRIYSPGEPEQFADSNGVPVAASISEKTFVTIGGIRQGMIIKSKNIHNPVLLYLHGGIPDYFLSIKYPTGLEDYFTVVWWEQRGSGLSYNANLPLESLTLEQMIADTREVTNYLRRRFKQEKIYLTGRSGGSFIGIHVAAQAPELFHAYIGMAQISYQFESERLAYEYMVEQYKVKGDKKMLRKLKSSPVTLKDGISDSYYLLRDKAMHSLGIGTTHDMRSIITGIFLPSLTCKDYTLTEKFNLWRGKARSGVHPLWDTILATNLSEHVPELRIPVYFIHGIYDYTVSYSMAKAYFEKLKAPVKGFYTFEQSAHSPIFEEPDRMRKIFVTDVLTGSNSLADKK